MATIRTERGTVSVLDADCARRPCLHVHWSRYASETIHAPPTGKYKGARLQVFPLVCARRDEQGCPSPLPEPAPK